MTGIDFSKLNTRNRDPGMGIQPDNYHGPNPDGAGRSDKYPENMVGRGNFRDTGCSLAPSCLKCPLVDGCIYDRPAHWERTERNARIRRFKARGKHVDEIAKRFGLSTRSIHRITQR